MPKDNTLFTYGRYGALGFEFAGAVVAGILLGRYLDGVFGTPPLLMVLGSVGGMAGALYRLIIVLQHLSRPPNNLDNANNNRKD
jgi:F0F1-type ATP synthase assembly protein I